MDRLLNSAGAELLLAEYGRDEVRRAARAVLDQLRAAITRGQPVAIDPDSVCLGMRRCLESDRCRAICRVINLSGTLLHTNLGRAVLPRQAIDAALEVMRGASTLEYDLAEGKRGQREARVAELLCRLTGAEAATVVNNNAAAIMLLLNSLALNREVLVSRGELVEIGGSFRIADIITRSGCRLLEVGSTNRTHRRDYAAAIGEGSALVLKVHQSNYVIQGYTASVDERELAGLCRESGIALVVDLGSGALLNLEDYGLPHEPTPMETLASGADLVTFSGDKLLGGPQAGIILGRRELIERIDANPMKRAMRCDKVTIATLTALLQLYLKPRDIAEHLPILAMMTRDPAEIGRVAATLVAPLQRQLDDRIRVEVIDCESETGSGALPGHRLPSVGVALSPAADCAESEALLESIARAFRQLPVPVIGRIHQGKYILDCRGLEDAGEFISQLERLAPVH